jgi:hypothetical protein
LKTCSGYNREGSLEWYLLERRLLNMPSPFPGLDPFLEDQDYWKEFHTVFLTWTQYALADRVPETY